MNSTSRAANRTLLFLVGVIAVAVGVVLGAIGLVPAVADAARDALSSVTGAAGSFFTEPVLGDATWSTILTAVAAIILVLLLIRFIVRQGGGRTGALLERRGERGERTTIELPVARTLLEGALDEADLFAGRAVSAYRVQGEPMLKVSVRCRRGADPRAAADVVHRALADLETLIGAPVPALVQIGGGFRARRAPATRVH